MNDIKAIREKLSIIDFQLRMDEGEYEADSDTANLSEHVLTLVRACRDLARLLDEQPPAPLQPRVEVEILTSEGMTWGQFSEQLQHHLNNGWIVVSESVTVNPAFDPHSHHIWFVRLERPAPPAAPQPIPQTVADLEF